MSKPETLLPITYVPNQSGSRSWKIGRPEGITDPSGPIYQACSGQSRYRVCVPLYCRDSSGLICFLRRQDLNGAGGYETLKVSRFVGEVVGLTVRMLKSQASNSLLKSKRQLA